MYAITPRAGTYRILAIEPNGRRRFLATMYATEEAALTRLKALQAMDEADERVKRLAGLQSKKKGA
jgi:hypothetical protein